MSTPSATVVVGASAAGLSTVEALRRAGHVGRVVLVGEEPHLPYDRPPLSKRHLVDDVPAAVLLRESVAYADLDVELRLGARARAVDLAEHRVDLEPGPSLTYDQLVIATGVRPRLLRQGHELAGVHVLRTLDDAERIRRALHDRPRVAVVGGGFLGAELVSSARTLGLAVTWLFPESAPMTEVLGPEVGGALGAHHVAEGVELRNGVLVDRLDGVDGRVAAAVDREGNSYPADVVLVCIGSLPNTEWLAGSGLELSNGVDCDEHCLAADDVYAAGDVASWLHPDRGARVRVEHRLNASEQALVVAHNLVHGPERVFAPVPYFWSDQYSLRLQAYGFPALADGFTVTEGGLAERRFAGVWTAAGEVVAVGGIGSPRAVRELRSHLIRAQAPVS
ncbi:NAD(P)/FAD-dependent oxidoreductase [Nocardioides humi]|uniref:FAD-dependent oxidoreductase n=1 Tax=Nocardioides humi TaxID=449461 RepID=A0ABN2AB62_9ACTN|nr:FAD-dependent oxidoreductase [Nocardioides humi]